MTLSMDGYAGFDPENTVLEEIISKLLEGVKVIITITISTFFENQVRIFLVKFDPPLPITLEADTELEAIEKGKNAVRFLLNNETKDRGLDINMELLEIQVQSEVTL